MQNVKHLLSLLLLIKCLTGFSQEKNLAADTLPYEQRYKTLKDLYIKHIDTENYKTYQKANWAYYDMLNIDAKDGINLMKLGPLEWSKANLYKTDFGSFEEAEREWKKVENAMTFDTKENVDYLDYYMEFLDATKVYDIELTLQAEVKKEHPEKILKRPEKKKKESFLPKLPSLPNH